MEIVAPGDLRHHRVRTRRGKAFSRDPSSHLEVRRQDMCAVHGGEPRPNERVDVPACRP